VISFAHRSPDFVYACHFLRFAEAELRIQFSAKAFTKLSGNYFPIDDLELALAGITYSDVKEACTILDKEEKGNPLQGYYEKICEVEVRPSEERSDELTTPFLATKTTHTPTSAQPSPSP